MDVEHELKMNIKRDQELLKYITETKELMWQLLHHHRSQGKDMTTPCSKKYNRSIANRIGCILGIEERNEKYDF